MNEYDQQAADFLNKTKTRLLIKFLRYGRYFDDDKEARLIFEFTLSRGNRSYTSSLGESVVKTFQALTGRRYPNRMTISDEEDLNKAVGSITGGKVRRADMSGLTNIPHPSAYSILACLEKSEPDPNVDIWARDVGYEWGKNTSIQRILETHKTCREQYLGLCTLFNEEEMAELAEIS